MLPSPGVIGATRGKGALGLGGFAPLTLNILLDGTLLGGTLALVTGAFIAGGFTTIAGESTEGGGLAKLLPT